MARYKYFLDSDVLQESKSRIHHVYDIFDNVIVMFSGGKDSLVLLNLVHEVAQERGISKVKVVFRDEELIPTNVIDLVNEYRLKPWVEMLWFCVPLASKKYCMGVSGSYIQWDSTREWLRPMPEWSYKLAEGDNRVFDQHTMDDFTATFYKGKLAFMTGIRADESLMRFRGVVNKLNENYITAPTKMGPKHRVPVNLKLVKPIYDWSENDIFKYLYDNDIKYASIYDSQILSNSELRVATPLHAEAAKKMHKLKEIDPVFFDNVMKLFPDMAIQARYYKDFDKNAIKEKYGTSLEKVREWIELNIIDPGERKTALWCFEDVLPRARRYPKVYPPDYILTAFINGTFKRKITPLQEKTK